MFALLPAIDIALIAFLRDHASLTTLHGGRVGTALGSDLTSIRVASIGGIQPWPWEGVHELQVECWGGTQAQALTLARTVNAAIYDMRGSISGGYVTSAVPSLAPLWQPDDQTGRPRYITQVQITAVPA